MDNKRNHPSPSAIRIARMFILGIGILFILFIFLAGFAFYRAPLILYVLPLAFGCLLFAIGFLASDNTIAKIFSKFPPFEI